MPEERRKHKRFRGKEGAFAAFLGPRELINLGNIVDISMGGLCIRYLCTSNGYADCTGIKVFGSNGRFIHVDKMECKIVYDVEIPEVSVDKLSTRRRGVQFVKLNVRQMALLQDFIEHFTTEESYQ